MKEKILEYLKECGLSEVDLAIVRIKLGTLEIEARTEQMEKTWTEAQSIIKGMNRC